MVIASKATAEVSSTVDGVDMLVTITGSIRALQDPAVMRDFVHQMAEAAEQTLRRLGGGADGGDRVPAEDQERSAA